MVLEGMCDIGEEVIIYKTNKAITFEQLSNSVNGIWNEDKNEYVYDKFDFDSNIILEVNLEKFTRDIDELIVLLTNADKNTILS